MDKKNKLLIEYFDVEALSTKIDYPFNCNSVAVNITNQSRKSLRVPVKSFITVLFSSSRSS